MHFLVEKKHELEQLIPNFKIMKTKSLHLYVRLLPTIFLLLSAAACRDTDEPTTEYPVLEGLHAITEEQRIGESVPHLTHPVTHLYFYSETLPLFSFLGATATICPLSENYFNTFIYKSEGDQLISKQSSYTLLDSYTIYRSSTILLPNCNEDDYRIDIRVPVPKDDNYDFYLKIENPEKNIYFRTPKYRFRVRSEDPTETQNLSMFFTTIEPIE